MDNFARFSTVDRRSIIQERATQMNVDFTIVEKDFWVCRTLKSLFNLPPENAVMTFKGGTSLSQAYGLIAGFSEDINVVIDPGFFLARGAADPEEAGRSKTKREERMNRLDDACVTYIGNALLSTLRADFAERLNSSDRNTLLFQKSEQFAEECAHLFRLWQQCADEGQGNMQEYPSITLTRLS